MSAWTRTSYRRDDMDELEEFAMDELESFANRLEEAAARREDVTLFGVDYMAAPVDEDGVPWHVGDEMLMDGEVCEVVGIGDGIILYAFEDGVEWTRAAYNRHLPRSLKPCPLCGGKAEYLHVGGIRHPWSGVQADALAVTVQCPRCGCTIPSDRDQGVVTKLWNRRAS